MPFMTRIPSDLARFGLKVELVPGWNTRGTPAFAPAAVTCHWTAGPRNTKARPSLNVCINGRPGIPGPLCNIYLARDGTCVVVAAGRANHAGVGGFRGLVGNSAVYGIEAESGGDGDWTPEMLDAYPRLVAALLSGLGRDASWCHGHSEWTPRKIDIRDVIGRVRADTARHLAGGTPAAKPAPAPALKQQKETDLMFHSLGPDEHMTFARPEGGDVKVKLAYDNNGITGLPDAEQRVRVAIHNVNGHWRNIYPGSKEDVSVFWMPQGETRGFTVTPFDDIVVIRNLHSRLNLGVTITHTP